MLDPRTILLIGGTGEAAALNAALCLMDNIHLITSLAGRTKAPPKLSGEILADGFSEPGGMDAFLVDRKIDLVIDASHPFAAQISEKANILCQKHHISYIRFERPPWQKQAADQWIEAADMTEAASLLVPYDPLFLTIGRQELNHFDKLAGKTILVRSIEDIDFNPVNSRVIHIRDRGPFSLDEEISLMQEHGVQAIISKNSGGEATYAKIAAARALSLPVIMIKRPRYQPSEIAHDTNELLMTIRLSS